MYMKDDLYFIWVYINTMATTYCRLPYVAIYLLLAQRFRKRPEAGPLDQQIFEIL